MTHASFAIGCATRAVDERRAFAKSKVKPPFGQLNELHTVRRDPAFAHGEVRAAEAYVRLRHHGVIAATPGAALAFWV